MGRQKLLAMGAVLLTALLSLGSGTSWAQEDDPYGSTTTTSQPPAQVECRLTPGVGQAGKTRIKARVTNVPAGADVRILFDGVQVAHRPGGAGDPQQTETVELSFIVPANAQPGEHNVDAVGPTFNARCLASNGDNFEVLSVGQDQGAGDSEQARGLAFTGVEVALLVAAAVALLLVGRVVLAESRRRRRRHARRAAERRRERAGV